MTHIVKNAFKQFIFSLDSLTACPETLKEFYNQRRRWDPSILANYWNILTHPKKFIKNNKSMSIFYICFQYLNFIITILGPGYIFINLVTTVEIVLEIANFTSFIINLIPVIMFIIVCFFAKEDVQIKFALVLSIGYGIIVMAAPILMLIQMSNEYFWFTTNLLRFCLVFCPILLGGILHPQVQYLSKKKLVCFAIYEAKWGCFKVKCTTLN